MNSIVLDLQNEVTKPNCDIVNVLRKAHLIAVKLGLVEFDKWIANELNGYKNIEVVPDYRVVRGTLKAFNPYRGWIPVLISNMEYEDSICNRPVLNSISEIITMCTQNENGIQYEFQGSLQDELNRMFDTRGFMTFAVHLPVPAVGDIVEKVKTAVMEWTIRLEAEGILGEGMQFNSAEKETAKRIPQTINNYYGNTNVINAPVDRSVVIAGNDNSVEFTYEKAKEIAMEIETSLTEESISAENQETAMEMIKEIKEKVSEQKKPSVIKAALVGLKDFLIGVGASATVAIIDAKLKGLI